MFKVGDIVKSKHDNTIIGVITKIENRYSEYKREQRQVVTITEHRYFDYQLSICTPLEAALL